MISNVDANVDDVVGAGDVAGVSTLLQGCWFQSGVVDGVLWSVTVGWICNKPYLYESNLARLPC